jgi:carbohydrate diacid regulator
MSLSKTKMQKIVEELRLSIDRDINIMDETGCIIASTDPTRPGIIHSGAQKIIQQRMTELLIGDETCFEGARRGINFPIYINDEIVGVVGITGEREEVEPFGKIIKKMTEILISEEYQKDQTLLIENTKNNFVYSWLFEPINEDEQQDDKFIASGKLLGINVCIPRIIIILHAEMSEVEVEDDVKRQMLNNRIIKRIRKLLDYDPQNIVVQIGARIIILLQGESTEAAYEKIKEIKVQIEQKYNVKIAGGIGSVGSHPLEIRQSYKEAEMSCDLMYNLKDKGIKVYGDIDMELLLKTIPAHNRNSFVNKIFKNCSKKEVDGLMLLLRTLVENNGSISQTAEQLYLHKNTVQYRLLKLKELTGYDPRSMKELVPLYVGMLIYEENKYIKPEKN